MTNKKLIEKILKAIDYKNHKLSKSFYVEDEEFWHINYVTEPQNLPKVWCVVNQYYETALSNLTNRELIKLYQSL